LGTEILKLIDQYNLLKDSGIVVIETELQEEIEIGKPFELDKEAKYGITKVTYVRKERP
jgi:16S rRNA G966 N2-methylase RsmD